MKTASRISKARRQYTAPPRGSRTLPAVAGGGERPRRVAVRPLEWRPMVTAFVLTKKVVVQTTPRAGHSTTDLIYWIDQQTGPNTHDNLVMRRRS